MTVLAVRSLSKSFGGVHAVNEASFDVGAGEFLAMIGPNGAGKSTCFNMINGQLAPDSGDILLDGDNIAGLAPREVWRRRVGRSIDGLVMVLLGGIQTLTGPIVGASFFATLQDTVMRQTEYWRALLGGIQTLAGPIVGAGVYATLQDTVMRQTEYWRALLGLIILFLVLIFPSGIAGTTAALAARFRAKP